MDSVGAFFDRVLQGDADAILTVAAIYFVVAAAYSLIQQLRMRRWPSIQGTLLQMDVEALSAHPNPAEQNYISRSLYEYTVDGHPYTGDRVSAWTMMASHNAKALIALQHRSVQVGDNNTVTVFYNPRKPSKALLVQPGIMGMCITALFGAFPLILLAIR